jgi:hypothetical protein
MTRDDDTRVIPYALTCVCDLVLDKAVMNTVVFGDAKQMENGETCTHA